VNLQRDEAQLLDATARFGAIDLRIAVRRHAHQAEDTTGMLFRQGRDPVMDRHGIRSAGVGLDDRRIDAVAVERGHQRRFLDIEVEDPAWAEVLVDIDDHRPAPSALRPVSPSAPRR
jgi:hypothetical protein